jgi:chromosome segregation ATPase
MHKASVHKASIGLIALLLVSSLSLWGCSQQQTATTNAKIKELESRYVKLEEDYRVVSAANETHRKKLTQIESQRADLAKQVEELQAVVQERDQLKRQVAERTQERDAVHSQLTQFSKEVQLLAGRIEAAATSHSFGSSVTVGIPASRKAP